MTTEELQSVIDELQKKHSPDEILVAFGRMYEDDKITKDQLMGLADAIGAELNEEFKNAPDGEESKKLLFKTSDDANPELTEKQLDNAEEDPNGSPAPSDGGGNTSKDEDDDKGEDEEDSEDSEEAEKDKAMKLMGL